MREVIPDLGDALKDMASPGGAFGGPDPDAFAADAPEMPYVEDLSSLPGDVKSRMLRAGVMTDDLSGRAGTFIQVDHTPVHISLAQD
ncbi:MAG: hypothetical protein KAQ74_00275, partial [Dehalococcoidia bacterium]|nr:hypothetical protein [Dehalococcoidia bacterium]